MPSDNPFNDGTSGQSDVTPTVPVGLPPKQTVASAPRLQNKQPPGPPPGPPPGNTNNHFIHYNLIWCKIRLLNYYCDTGVQAFSRKVSKSKAINLGKYRLAIPPTIRYYTRIFFILRMLNFRWLWKSWIEDQIDYIQISEKGLKFLKSPTKVQQEDKFKYP